MTSADVDDVDAVVRAANDAAERRAGRDPQVPTDEQRKRFRRGTLRFIQSDGPGAWVAERDGDIVGMAEAIRRNGFWGLSMLFVHPRAQSQGIGRQLLDVTLPYAEGADVRMIMTSEDPRALRRYALAGLAIHPAVQATGTLDRQLIPAGLPGREGSHDDLDLVHDVDRPLDRSRADDVAFLMSVGARLQIVDEGARRGFGVHRAEGPIALGATDTATAVALLWRMLAEGNDKTEIYGLTAAQGWAVNVCLQVRLKVEGGGPLFIDGLDHPPGPWLPSGWYF